jgi:hypothetical protein
MATARRDDVLLSPRDSVLLASPRLLADRPKRTAGVPPASGRPIEMQNAKS